MKNLIIVLFSLMAYANSSAQGYTSIIDTSLTWEGFFDYSKNGQSTGKPVTYRFSNKDTVFKKDTFRILIAYTAVDTFVMGGLSEDTATKKVYGFYAGDTSAYLMYDYSLKKDDSFIINPTFYYKINNVSNITLYGIQRKKLSLYDPVSVLDGIQFFDSTNIKKNCLAIDFDFIEGIGSLAGVLNFTTKLKSKYITSKIYVVLPDFDNQKWKIGIKKVIKNNIEYVFNPFDCSNPSLSIEPIQRKGNELFIGYYTDGVVTTIKIQSEIEVKSVSLIDITGKTLQQFSNIGANETELLFNNFLNSQKFLILETHLINGQIKYNKLPLK